MHWCTCLHWRPVDGFESQARQAATHIMSVLNSFTAQHRDLCHELSLKRIEDAKMVFPNEKVGTELPNTFFLTENLFSGNMSAIENSFV